jgi:hypothetical protein
MKSETPGPKDRGFCCDRVRPVIGLKIQGFFRVIKLTAAAMGYGMGQSGGAIAAAMG